MYRAVEGGKVIVVVGSSELLFGSVKGLEGEIYAVDDDRRRLEAFLEESGGSADVKLVYGKPSDVEVWRKLNLSTADLVLTHLGAESTLGVVQILRNIFGYAGQVVCILDSDSEIEKLLYELEAEVVKPHRFIRGYIEEVLLGKGAYRTFPELGAGKGEVVEVRVQEFSPLLGMRIMDIKQRGLKIALVYRNGEVLLPVRELKLEVGDRLLVVGKPDRVNLFIHTFVIGDYRFPLEWGNRVLLCGEEVEEVKYLRGLLGTGKVEKVGCDELKNIDASVGGVIFTKGKELFRKDYLRFAFEGLEVPSFFLKGSSPYKNILISLNTDTAVHLLVKSVSFIRYINARVDVLYVSQVEESLSKEERERIGELKSLVERLNRVFSLSVNFLRKEGNPVRETLKLLKEYDLLLLGYKVGKRGSFFSPYTPYILSRKSSVSTLLIPEVSD